MSEDNLQAYMSTTMLAIHELNKKYDLISMEVNRVCGININDIIINSNMNVDKLMKKHDELNIIVNSFNNELKTIKLTNNNINSHISNSIISVQELNKKHSDINNITSNLVIEISELNKRYTDIMTCISNLNAIKNPNDINLDVVSIISNSASNVEKLSGKHIELDGKIKELNHSINKPRPLDPHISELINNSVGTIKELKQKYNELSTKIEVKNNVTIPASESVILANLDTRLKKIEELLNLV